MGEGEKTQAQDTEVGPQHMNNMNLINYVPMAQFPPLPNRDPSPKLTVATTEKSYTTPKSKYKVSSTNIQSEANENANEQG